MKKILLVALMLPLALWGAAKKKPTSGIPDAAAVRTEISSAAGRAARVAHPRLFGTAKDFAALRARRGTDELVRLGADRVVRGAEALLKEPVLTRKQEGRRLLGVSREALYRISTLAMAFRLTDDVRFRDRGVAELRAVCAFSNWNPSHFLDVAEMSLAVATGYDWFYPDLDPAVRKEIAAGLRRHGLDASRSATGWVRSSNNWGQVCHAGILAAALALAEEDPAETGAFVQRCVDNITISMKALAPNGNYPEGPGYWNYGVEFNAIALMLLEGTLGNDFGLAKQPGLKETAEYLDVVTGPSGLTFNYADGGSGRGSSVATWWLASRFQRPDILPAFEVGAYRKYCADPKARGRNRLFAHSLFYVKTPPADCPNRQPLVWDAQGPVPIVVQRASWDKDAFFVGLKGGSPSANHGHMDAGSFVLEAKGVRWAVDLGAESYNRIEQLGMGLWNMKQDSDRWKIYRLNTESHNELMLDGQPQYVRGFAKVTQVTKGPGSTAVLDLTSLYTNATRVVRTGTLAADGRSYTLTDEVAGLKAGAPIRWSLMTRAEATVDGASVVLKEQGKTLRVTATTGAQRGQWQVVDAKGPNAWDAENKGCRQLQFTFPAPEKGTAKFAVRFE